MGLSLYQTNHTCPFFSNHLHCLCNTIKKNNNFESRQKIFPLLADVPHAYVHALTFCCFHSLISMQTSQRALTALVDSCVEIKMPHQQCNQFWRSLEEGARKQSSEYGKLHVTLPEKQDLKRWRATIWSAAMPDGVFYSRVLTVSDAKGC